jgi:uncharacterized protein (TIGR02996 family)
MDEHLLRAFLDDIKANPLEDTPRLILADWLEEHGDTDADRARGTLMRAQCQEDVTLAYSLLQRYRATWLGDLGALPLNISFVRGLGWIAAPMAALLYQQAVESPAWRWVETLEVVGQEGRLSPLWRLPFLEEISNLRFHGQPHWAHVRMARLLGCRHLARLHGLYFLGQNLPDNQVAQLARWEGLSRLHHLGFHSMTLGENALEDLAFSAHLRAIQRLELCTIRTSARGLRILLRSDGLPHLRELTLRASDPDLEILSALVSGALAEVARLDLAAVGLLDDGATSLADLALPALRDLGLSSCGIGLAGGLALAQAPWLANLRSLDLAGNRPGDSLLRLLAGPLGNLTRLSLANAGLGVTFIEALAAAPHLRRLARLDLANNPLDVPALTALSRAENLPALRRLNLNACGITDRAALALADWPALDHLDVLDLLGNEELTEAGLGPLRERARTILL